MLADIFAVAVLVCLSGPSMRANQCTVARSEPMQLVTVAECQKIGRKMGREFTEKHPGTVVRGITCWRLPDFLEGV